MITKIKNGKIIYGDSILDEINLYIKDNKILKLAGEGEADQVIDAEGKYISPGFIDIHTHGGGGADFMDGTAEAYFTAARLHATHGTTTMYPTTVSGSTEDIIETCRLFDEAKKGQYEGARLEGLHLEGPYFAMSAKGAQNPSHVRNPLKDEYLKILSTTDSIKRWSAAPELPGAIEFGRELEKRGILASMGHSEANYDEVVNALSAGFTHVTHLYSCTSTVHRKNAYRFAGIVEASYLLPDLTVEIIADGVHLPKPLLEFVYRFKGADKTALVTDSMRGAGCPEGKSILGGIKDGMEVIIEDGVAKLPDRTSFAGSVATMDRLVRNMLNLAGATLTDAVKMAALTPARIMGLSDRGMISPGMLADIVIFDGQINISKVLIGGRVFL